MSIRLNYEEAILRVCVDSVDHGCLSGRLFGQRLSEPVPFRDIGDLVLKVEALLDAQNTPQAFSKIRSFTETAEPNVPAARTRVDLSDPQSVIAACGTCATFTLQIFSRQNATWQGRLDWLDGTPCPRFSSTLAFMKLIADRLAV